MLLFLNKEKHTYFAVHNQLCKVEFLSAPTVRAFRKYSDYFGGIEILELPDIATIKKFRKLVAFGAFKDIPLSETRKYLLEHYPEFFI